VKRRTTIWVYPVSGIEINPHEHIQNEIRDLEDTGLTVVNHIYIHRRHELWVFCEGDEEDEA